jgi:glycosyltransferase involved in cell wall biosynthesis
VAEPIRAPALSVSDMNLQDAETIELPETTKPRLRAVVFGGGIGMFPPLMNFLREEYEIVAELRPRESRLQALWYRLLTIRWSRHAWYRAWRYHMEKTGHAFRSQTADAARQLEALEQPYDVILFFGAMFAPGPASGKPLFLFTDSCRWLSARNLHDSISHFRDERDAREWLQLEGDVYRRAARIFVGSDFVRDALIEHYGVAPERAVTSGFGAGLGFGDPYEKVFDGRTILYIGKGDFEKKGGVLLMQAFEQVRAAVPDAQLHIVGQDRLPEAAGVVNHGFVRERGRIVDLMRSAHVFALPSLVDRNPISILEAMATSTPCVASDYGAMPELVGDAGLIAPCNDVDRLAQALVRLLQDKALARTLGERGRARFEQRFNWDSAWRVIRREMREALA